MTWKFTGVAGAVAMLTLSGGLAQADSISDVENARAKDRAGYHLNRSDREQLRRYGRSDDYGWHGGYGAYDDYGYYGGPGISVYVGPGHHHGRYRY